MGSLVILLFQAEDGIRDLVRSRGLGDVYKRQPEALLSGLLANYKKPEDLIGENGLLKQLTKLLVAVSYTHLTLPTSDLV